MPFNILSEFKKTFKVAKKEYIKRFIIAVILRGILLIIPVLLSYAIEYVSKGEINSAILLIIISIIVTVLYRFSECAGSKAYYNLYNKIYSYYNSMGVDKTNENSIFSLSRFTLGQYTNMLTTDVDIISQFFTNSVLRSVQMLEFFVIYIYFFSIDIFLFISVVLLSILILCFIPRMNKKIEKLNGKKKEEQDKQIVSTHEYFLTTKEIKSFNLFDKISSKPKNQTDDYLKSNSKYINKYNFNNYFILLLIEIFRLLSVLYAIYLVTNGHMEIGMILIIYNYYQKIIDNFSTILTINVELTNFKISLARFNHLIEFSKPKEKFNYTIDHGMFKGKIDFKHILYGFRHDPILNDVSFTVEPNTITAITGKESSGKSGISNLLLKFNRQHEGEIFIDNLNINDIPDDEYFKIISLVREQPVFFNCSIKENLTLIESDFEKITNICKELGIHDEILNLPNGYDTIMDENSAISTSTKQILAIARILLKNSKILLFDEALSMLDENSQNTILNVLQKLKSSHTIVLISHDRNILKDVDNIILLDKHTTVESGSLKELIDKKGRYYELFEAQTDMQYN